EAINCGATEVDAIILQTEVKQLNRLPSKNPFSLMMNVFSYMKEHLEHHNILVGKLKAKHKNVKLNLYFTPTVLTTNSLIFDKREMRKWWKEGYLHAKNKELEILH
ncbi:MAG: patatin-like phospholipase family protein, partial [Bacteroidota bacterium]